MIVVEEQGYVIVAIGDNKYYQCASKLAHSIKQHVPDASVCLIADRDPSDPVYNHVRLLAMPNLDNPFANDWQVFWKSPYRETIKLEADMLITSPIDHWWTMFRHRDIVVSTGCRDWKGNVGTARNYRLIFDENHLPDVYNAITYWRLSKEAKEFFTLVRVIFEDWHIYQKVLKFAPDIPDTDLVYAVAAQIYNPDRCTLPFTSYPQIVHMKRHIAGTSTEAWTNELVWEQNPFRINTVAQWGAFHYNVKDWTQHD